MISDGENEQTLRSGKLEHERETELENEPETGVTVTSKLTDFPAATLKASGVAPSVIVPDGGGGGGRGGGSGVEHCAVSFTALDIRLLSVAFPTPWTNAT
jgi:hypothetical protein